MILYVDTSAALKLLIEEPESEPLAEELTTRVGRGDRLVSSMLLYTELHCAARRRAKLAPELVNSVTDSINLVDIARADLMYAAALAGGLRSADAIHLATAVRLEADSMVAYDAEPLAAAAGAGLSTLAPD
ncbi:hypothetical protein GCM10009784_26680 [Arthrobacter parietis]|uniref:PIN domain-containing protein n=1 Tax=Arthrobacter parietis TaxID=271434 RepID=A0ABN3B1A9_9MICC